MHEHIHPTKCFCQVPEEKLKKWAAKRYQENKTTVELLVSTDDAHEKEIISIVCLLDVDDKIMLEMMGDVDFPEHHILHCRDNVRELLSMNGEKQGS